MEARCAVGGWSPETTDLPRAALVPSFCFSCVVIPGIKIFVLSVLVSLRKLNLQAFVPVEGTLLLCCSFGFLWTSHLSSISLCCSAEAGSGPPWTYCPFSPASPALPQSEVLMERRRDTVEVHVILCCWVNFRMSWI